MTGAWWCEAYGPPPDDADPAAWPVCFITAGRARRCASSAVCAVEVAGERRRVFRRIQELAAGGDEAGRYLADTFTNPNLLLNADPDSPDVP